jgi:predicted nucleic acid-binding protein
MAQILVDTSAWIEFYHPRGDKRVKTALIAAFEKDEIGIVAPIIVELLRGAKTQRVYELLWHDLQRLEILELKKSESEAAAQLGWILASKGKRIPTIDLLIAGAAQVHGYEIWHFGDNHFLVASSAGEVFQRDLKN